MLVYVYVIRYWVLSRREWFLRFICIRGFQLWVLDICLWKFDSWCTMFLNKHVFDRKWIQLLNLITWKLSQFRHSTVIIYGSKKQRVKEKWNKFRLQSRGYRLVGFVVSEPVFVLNVRFMCMLVWLASYVSLFDQASGTRRLNTMLWSYIWQF